jgi:alpha-tubulin suppressor-like RCC1 family protein
MYGTPIYRRNTPFDGPDDCTDPFGCCLKPPCKPRDLKSSLDLAQMVLNHFSLIINANKNNIMSWGGTGYGAVAPSVLNSNVPSTCLITWDSVKKTIVRLYSSGGADPMNSFFLTFDGELYGTGSNSTYMLNKSSAASAAKAAKQFCLVAKNVIDFCISGKSYLLYVKGNKKLYGLGPKIDYGFGFANGSQKLLDKDVGTDSNYLGINDALKVFSTSPLDSGSWPGGNVTTYSRSFVLREGGLVSACGNNAHGSLGVNSTDGIIYEWRTVCKEDGTPLTNVIDIVVTNWVLIGGAVIGGSTWSGGGSSSYMSTYFLTSDGFVYTCGSNKFGQLGLGLTSSDTRIRATKTSLTKASSICTTAGGTSVLVTTTDDEVYSWGNNQWGQLGLGNTTDTFSPTKAVIPKKKIRMIHGGGMYGMINGAFIVVYEDGSLYAAGFNETYALGATIGGVPIKGPITTFTRNEYFGEDPPLVQDPDRYPLLITGTITAGSDRMVMSSIFSPKTGPSPTGPKAENVYINKQMTVTGIGIPTGTKVLVVDPLTKTLILSNKATDNRTDTYTFNNILKVYQADLCGYGTEMALKAVTEDKTLFMAGWNQNLGGGLFNFNYYYDDGGAGGSAGTLVGRPTTFNANFS